MSYHIRPSFLFITVIPSREMSLEKEEVTPVFGDDFEEKERQFLNDFLNNYKKFGTITDQELV